MNELALFAGAGGGILGGHLLGWTTICAVERDEYAAKVLLARQNDSFLPRFPIWDDVSTFDGKPWHGLVDVVSGGFPCQDISSSGRGAGLEGERSGLWKEMARIIDEVKPRFAFIENSPLLKMRGLPIVLKNLHCMGYDAEWGIFGAHHIKAPHKRNRMWIVAHARKYRSLVFGDYPSKNDFIQCWNSNWWDSEPTSRLAKTTKTTSDQLSCLGNGQVPAVAASAFMTLARRGGWV